jgi:hypothetical protein
MNRVWGGGLLGTNTSWTSWKQSSAGTEKQIEFPFPNRYRKTGRSYDGSKSNIHIWREEMPNTQKEVKPRPDRGVTVNHVVVPAHGATPDHVKESDFDGHTFGEFEHKGENDERVVKASKVTAGRHITSKDGLQVARERTASIKANRDASAKLFDSTKLTVCPEQKGRKRK